MPITIILFYEAPVPKVQTNQNGISGVTVTGGFIMERTVYDAKPSKAKTIIWIVAAVLIVIVLFNSFTTIEAGTVGVVYRFGAIKGYVTEGLHFLVPFVDSVRPISIQKQKIQFEAASFTKSAQELKIIIAVNYRISEEFAPYVMGNIGDIPAVENKVLAPNINEIVKAIVSQYPTDQIHLNREKIKIEAKDKLNEAVRYGTKLTDGKEVKIDTGIIIEDVNLVNIQFSEQYTQAIEAKQVAEQKVQEAEFNRQKALKEKEIAQIQGEAEKIKQQSIGLSLNPLIIQNKWIEKWDGKMPTVVSGSNGIIIDPFKK
jgi:regulator of protease activity HflC (stomatin/prohibitin superfamily)